MKTAFLLLTLSQMRGGYPQEPNDFVGSYDKSNGYEVWTLTIQKNGVGTESWRPDHPGGKEWPISWRIEGGLLKVRHTTPDSREWEYVPIRWGDWVMLMDKIEVAQFSVDEKHAIRRLKSQSPDKDDERWSPDCYSRSVAKKGTARRFGELLGPPKYIQLFQDLKIGG